MATEQKITMKFPHLCQGCKERILCTQNFQVSSHAEQISLVLTILNVSLGNSLKHIFMFILLFIV